MEGGGNTASPGRDQKLLRMLWGATWANNANMHWFVYKTMHLKFVKNVQDQLKIGFEYEDWYNYQKIVGKHLWVPQL
jgi:hypothetical protein